MQTQAPYPYIRDYYRQVQEKYRRFPEMASFCRAELKRIRGARVLNVGCGPLLYDDLQHFGQAPHDYLGLDINRSSFDFLRRSRDPRLLRAKAHARASGTSVDTLCGDILECGTALAGRFDAVLGVGVVATFHGERFERLTALLREALQARGTLLKITWHGPHRTPEETRKKLAYRYDSPEEPTPEALVEAMERAGFSLEHQSILPCDPETYGWDAIQACLFRNT